MINIDADKFLGNTVGTWDVVIVDFPDPNAVELTKLYSKEFYLKLRARLSPEGLVVVQSTSPYHARETYLCINRTIEAAGFATTLYHDNVPSFGDWGWILACNNSSGQGKDLVQRINQIKFSVPTAYLDERVFHQALVFGKGRLVSKHNDVNTLMHPVLLHRYVDESWQID